MDNERKEGSEGWQYPSFALFGGWRIARPLDTFSKALSRNFAKIDMFDYYQTHGNLSVFNIQ